MAEQHGSHPVQHAGHHVNYFAIFLALCGLTILSIITDVIEIENRVALGAVVLAVATAKALFVLMYFMHLKFEGNWKYVLLAPTLILAIGLPLALLPDIGIHYYMKAVPQEEAIFHQRGELTAPHEPPAEHQPDPFRNGDQHP